MVFFAKFVAKEETLMTYKDRKKLFFFFLPQALENSFKFLNPSYMQLPHIFIVNYFVFMLYVFLG